MTEKKMKVTTINVYLTYQDKKVLNEIKEKYHISYSCIAKVLLRNLMINIEDKIGYMVWADHYYYKDSNQTKTSIRPRLYYEGEKEFWKELKTISGWKSGGLTMILTNMLKAFCRNDIKKITGWTDEKVNKKRSQIYNQFQQEYDPNWNGNAFARQFARFAKRNPDYTKKVLGINDDR